MDSSKESRGGPVSDGSRATGGIGGRSSEDRPPPMSPDEFRTYEDASAALGEGRNEDGIRLVRPFLDRGIKDHRFWHLHGLLLRSSDRREEALASLRRAVELGPRSLAAAHALARTLYEAGLPSSQAYGHAIRLSNSDPQLVMGLASAFIAEGEPGTAVSGLERIVARSPHWVDGHALLSRLRWAQGEREGFARSFDDALSAMPQDMDLRRQQLIALVHAERWDDAHKAIAGGRSAVGDQPLFALYEAIMTSETGNPEAAEPLFAPFADSSDATIQVRRVRHYLRWGRPADADSIIGQWVATPDAYMFWPYASVAWRMLDDARWDWLEGDPSFVAHYDISDRLPPLDELAAALRKLHTLAGQPLEQSLRGGTQTDGDIFTHIDPLLVRTREAIRETVAQHVAGFPPHDDRHPLLGQPRDRVAFSGAWSVRLASAGYHANHVHPVGWISSALYILLPPDLGREDSGFLTLGESWSPTFKVDLAPFRTVEPKPGRLALFPSYTWHGTRPFAEGERMTIAFDVARNA